MYTLDFTLNDAKSRAELVRSFDLSNCSVRDLNLIADYLCFGKDSDNLSPIDKHKIQIQTQYSSYSRKPSVSLEDLLSNPNYDESQLRSLRSTQYIHKKTDMSDPKYNEILGLSQLRESINKLEAYLEEHKDLDSRKQYVLKHELIALRKQQYALKEEWFPVCCCGGRSKKGEQYSEEGISWKVLPCGLFSRPNDPAFMHPDQSTSTPLIGDGKYTIDFTNQDHVKKILMFRQDLEEQAFKNPESLINNLLWTLDYYIERAELSTQHKIILEGKVSGLSNIQIQKQLQEKMGIYHQSNYISSIWTVIVGRITKAAELVWDEILCKNYDKAWQKCKCCGRRLLKDPRCFTRKGKGTDKVVNICKKCNKQRRNRNRNI